MADIKQTIQYFYIDISYKYQTLKAKEVPDLRQFSDKYTREKDKSPFLTNNPIYNTTTIPF